MTALLEAYFDESGSHDGSPVLCVAGYLYDKDDCINLDWQWKEVLDQYDLPFFRMVDCAHGTEPFDKLTKQDRIDVATRMIELVKKYMTHGLSVTIDEAAYNSWRADQYPLFGSAYTWCCWMMFVGIAAWAARHNFDGQIAFFFEAGHRYQKEADRVMNEMVDLPDFKYASHTFVRKVDMRPIQSADLLAWQAASFRKRVMKGSRKPRADFRSLVARNTVTFHGEKHLFDELHAKLGAYMDNPSSPVDWGAT